MAQLENAASITFNCDLTLLKGVIDEDGNAILIDEAKNHKDWKKAIIRLANDPALVKQLQTNLSRDICPKYNLTTVTEQRAEFYKKIIEDKKK